MQLINIINVNIWCECSRSNLSNLNDVNTKIFRLVKKMLYVTAQNNLQASKKYFELS